MPRKVTFDDRKRRRREKEDFKVCELEEIRVASPPVLSEQTKDALADALLDFVMHPEKYKELPEE